MEIFKSYSEEDIVDSFLDIIRYASRYFNTSTVNPIEFWSKILALNQDKKQWKVSLLLVEICLCAPFSNASLERLFSHMNIVKSTTRSRLSNRSLNSILRIGFQYAHFTINTFKNVSITGTAQRIGDCSNVKGNCTKSGRIGKKKEYSSI